MSILIINSRFLAGIDIYKKRKRKKKLKHNALNAYKILSYINYPFFYKRELSFSL